MMTRAAEQLSVWMEREKVKPPAVAEAVGVSKAAVYGWTKGEFRPEPIVRAKLERWTGGVVRERDWDTAEEARELATLTPHEHVLPSTGTGE